MVKVQEIEPPMNLEVGRGRIKMELFTYALTGPFARASSTGIQAYDSQEGNEGEILRSTSKGSWEL
jgi:hypothetical protein